MVALTEDPLTALAAEQPDRIALTEGDRQLDFAAFNAIADRYANTLIDLGVTAGAKVVWCGQNSIEVVVLTAAIRKAGGVAVPLNYRLSPEESCYVIENCDADVVCFDVEQAGQLGRAAHEVATVTKWLACRCTADEVPGWAAHLETEAAMRSASEAVPRGAHPAAGTTMFYTSGTTGRPKGVVRHGRDPDILAALVSEIGFRPDDVYLTTGPLYHSGPLSFMLIVLQVGGSVVVMRGFDPERWLEQVDRHRVSTTFSAPTPIRRILDLPDEVFGRYDVTSLRRTVANAAPWPFDLKRRYVSRIGEDSLFEVYGSTELGVDTILRPEDQMRKPSSCGRPAPGVEIGLFDDSNEPIQRPGVAGDLYIRSNASFDNYYKADQKYSDAKLGEWLTVGDIGYFDEEGFYYICDRRTDMIISGGMNIYPAEIEAVLTAHPAIADVAVFGIPSTEWGESVHAAVVIYPGIEVTDETLRGHCREHLASYKVPRSFDRIDEVPRNPSGKVLKRQLRDPYWHGRTSKVG